MIQALLSLLNRITPARAANLDNLDQAISSLSSGGGGVESVQRGVQASAGTVTISSVDTAKSIVLSVSKGSDGFVAARGTLDSGSISGSTSGTLSATSTTADGSGATFRTPFTPDFDSCTALFPNYSGTRTLTATAASRTLSSGTTDLTTKQYSAVLTNSTTLTCDGPVEWQVIEYS